MGNPGNYDDEDVKEALDIYEKIALKYNKLIGFHVVSPDYKQVLEKRKKGYNFIAFSFDAFFLGNTIREKLQHLK